MAAFKRFGPLAVLILLYNVLYIEGDSTNTLGYTFSNRADKWMKLHVLPATWSDARFICKAEGAILASPLTTQLRDAMVEHASARSVPIIFTGVHATYSKGAYTSDEGVPLSKLPFSWLDGEPNNYKNSESCLAMNTISHGFMGDVGCNEVFPFICYKTQVATGNTSLCGTHDTEYNFDSRTGKCYKFHRFGLFWTRAFITCMAEDAHLAIINSDVEFEVLRELIHKNPKSSIFSIHKEYIAIGFSDPNDGGSWRTIHDQTLKEAGFERWEPNEPNNASQPQGELCGVMARDSGNFNDAPCFWTYPFICEKNPPRLFDDKSVV